jgi:phage tail-like protein
MTDANALAASSKTTLYVRPSNYGVTHLYWSFISTGWNSVTLVRNVDGYPTSITDGETLYTWTSASSQSSTYLGISSKYHFFDTGAPNTSSTVNPGKGVVGTSLQGKTVYYALFMTYTVSSNQYVTRSATASTPVIKDDGLFNNLLEFIPAVYKPDNTDLEDFLGLFAFHLSLYKQQATNIFDMHKVPTVDAKLLTALLNQFGASLYGDMSVSQGRTLLANLIEMYTQVGSTAGIKNFIELYTGYNSRISPGGVPGAEVPGGGVNMLLDYNSSSFVESLGSWVPNTGTGTGYAATAPYNSFASWIKTSEASVYPYGYSGSDAYQGIFASKGFLKMTAVLGATQDVTLKLSPKITVAVTGTAATNTLVCKPLIAKVGDYVINPSVKKGTYVTGVTATTASLTLSNNLESTITAGTEVWFSPVAEDKQAALEANIPVVDVNQYTFSAFFNRGSNAGKSVKLAIMWYDSTGTFLSTSA